MLIRLWGTSVYFSARSEVKEGSEDACTSSLKLKRSLCARNRESGILSVRTKFQKPISGISSIFSPFISAKDRLFLRAYLWLFKHMLFGTSMSIIAEGEVVFNYMILTYGNRHGGATELTRQMMEDLGIHLSYINIVLMADNFLPGFDMNEQRALDKNVDGQIKRIIQDIASGKEYAAPVTDADRAVHREYLDRIAGMPDNVFSRAYRITDECIGCGICTKVCPKKCLHMEGQKSVWNPEGCMMCMACIHACPMMAIQMRMPEKNPKARYRNENISICEIVDANSQWGEDIPSINKRK